MVLNTLLCPGTYEAQVKATIANIAVDTTLFLKFLIDSFIYAWRLPKFRQAVRAIFGQQCLRHAVDVITMVNISFIQAKQLRKRQTKDKPSAAFLRDGGAYFLLGE